MYVVPTFSDLACVSGFLSIISVFSNAINTPTGLRDQETGESYVVQKGRATNFQAQKF